LKLKFVNCCSLVKLTEFDAPTAIRINNTPVNLILGTVTLLTEMFFSRGWKGLNQLRCAFLTRAKLG